MSSPDQQPVQRDPVKRFSDARNSRDPRERLNRASGDSRDPSARLNAAKTGTQYGRGMPSEIQPSEGERGTNIPYLPDRTARRFLAGVLDIGSMASAANEYVPDWAESYVGAGSLKELGAEAYELYKGDGEEYDAEDVSRAITRGLDQAASFVAPDHSQAAQDFMADRNSRQEEEGEFGSFANAARRNPIGALRYVGESATRAAPTMLASAGAAALTSGGSTVAQLGAAGGVGALIEAGAQAKDASLDPETGEYTDLTTNEKLWGLGSGLAAGSVEGIAGTVQGGTVGRLVSKTPAGRAIARMVGATADDVGEEASEEAVKAVGRRIRDYATEAGQNATTEGATEAVQNLISNYGAQQGWDPERELTEGVLDEALAGAFLGGGMSTVSSGANEMGIRADRQRQEKAEEITEQYGGTFRIQDDATANRWSENLDGVSFERGEEVEIDLSPTPRYNSTGEVLVTARQEDGTRSLFTTTESELQNGDPLAGMGFSAPGAYESIFDEGTLEPLGAEPAEEGRQGEIAFEEEEGPTDARQRAQRMRERRVDENARAIEAVQDNPIFGEQARRENARIGEIEASEGDTDIGFLEREVSRLDAEAARMEERGEDASALRERGEEVSTLLNELRSEESTQEQTAPVNEETAPVEEAVSLEPEGEAPEEFDSPASRMIVNQARQAGRIPEGANINEIASATAQVNGRETPTPDDVLQAVDLAERGVGEVAQSDEDDAAFAAGVNEILTGEQSEEQVQTQADQEVEERASFLETSAEELEARATETNNSTQNTKLTRKAEDARDVAGGLREARPRFESDGYSVQEGTSGRIHVVRESDGQTVDRQSSRHDELLTEYLAENETQIEERSGRTDPQGARMDEYPGVVAEQSTNPIEIAEAHVLAQSSEDATDTRNDPLLNALVDNAPYNSQGALSADASGDEILQRGLGNWVTEGTTDTLSLGQIADQFDGVTESDLVETMSRFDGGPSTVIPEDVAIARTQQDALAERFRDLTGKRLTPELARQITSRTDGQQEAPAIGNAPEAQTSDPVQGRDDFAVQEEREVSASEDSFSVPQNAEVRFSAESGSSSGAGQEASFSPADYDTPQAFLSAYRSQRQTQQPDRRAFQVSENGTDRQAVTQAIQSGDQTALTNALLGEGAAGAATATGNTVFALVSPENAQVTKERARSLGFTVTNESQGNRRTRLSLDASGVGNSDPQQQSVRLVRYEEAGSGPAGTTVAYREGATTGVGAVQGAGGKTVLTGEARIYDLATDPEGVVENEFDAAEVREALEGRGYDGFEQNGQVAFFSEEGFDSVERGVTQSDLYEARAEAPARRSDLIDDESYLQGEWTQDNRLDGTELSVRELPTGEWEVRRMDRRVDVFDSQEAAKTGALARRAKDSMNAGDSAEEVTRAVVDALFADSPVRDRITVVSEESDLPSDVRQAIETKGIEANGVFVGETGRIYLLPENIGTSPSRAITVALHETAGHLGLRTVLGDRLNPTLDRMWSERLQLSESGALEREEVRQIVMDYGIDFQTQAGQRELMEEVLARRAEQNVDIGFMEEVYAAVREFLRERLGFNLQITDAEIRRLIANSKRYARTGQYGVRLGPSTHNFGYEIETFLTMRSASQAIDDAYGRGAERVRQNIQQSLETAQTRFSRRPVQGEEEAFEEENNREEEIPERMGRRASVDEAVEGVEEAQEAARAYAEAYDRTLRYSQAEAPQDKEGGAGFDEMWNHVQAGGARSSTQRSRLEEVKGWMDRAGLSVWYNSYFKSTFRELDRYAERYPALKEIRDKLYTDNSTTRDEDRSEQDLMRRMELRNGEFMSDLAEVMRPIRDREGAFAWNQNREMHTRIFEILLGDEVGEGEAALATAARRMRQMLDRLAQYQVDAGMMDAESVIENYFPQVYRTDYIENNAERFIEWATEKWVRRLNETGWTPEDQLELGQEGEGVLEEEARERAVHLYKKLTKEGGMALEPGSSTKGYKYGKPNHLKQRSLDWISPQEKAEWLVQDPTQLMISYVNRTVQGAEFTRSFGQVDISEAGKSRIRDAERALESVKESGDESAIKSAERSLENTRLKEWQDAKPPVLRQAFRELKEAAADPEQNTPPDWLESRVESMMDAVRGTYELETAQENRTWNRAWQNMKSLLGAIMLTKSAFITSSVELGSASIRGGAKSIGAYGRLAARAADKVTNGALGLENLLGTTLDEEWVLEQAGVMGEGVSRSILEARYFSSMGQQAESDSFGKLTGTLYTAMGLKAMTDATRRLAGYTSKNVIDGLLTKETYSAREQREIKRVGLEENIEEMRAWYAENKGDLRSTRGSDELEAYKYALLMVSDGIIPEPNEATVPVGASSNSAVKASLFQYLSFVHSHLTSGPAGFVRDEIYDSFQDGAIEGGKTLFTMAIRFLPMLGLSYMNEIVSAALSYDDDEREERDLRRDRAPSDAEFALELWMNTGMMPFGAQTSTRLFQGVTKYNSSMWDQLVGPTYGKIGATGEAIVNSLGRGNADPIQREVIRTLPFLQAPQQRDLQEWVKED